MRGELLVAFVLASGCDQPTAVNLKIVPLADADPPAHLAVNVFEPTGRVATLELDRPRLPGTLNVRFKDLEQEIRLVAVATPAALGAVKLTTTPFRTGAAELRLGALADTDGDQVPDVVDGCPTVADPEQEATSASGPGTACLRGDAGVTDAGASDAGLGEVDAGLGGPSRCPVAGALWCEGFEGTLSGYPVQEENGVVRIVASPVARGSGALKAEVPNRSIGFGYATARNEGVIGAEDSWAMRAFLYAPSSTPARGASLLMARYSGDYASVAFGMSGANKLQLERNLGGQLQVIPSTATFPFERWICVELVHTRRNGLVDLQVFIDGVEDGLLAQTALPVSNRFDQLLVGMAIPQAGGVPGAAVIIDEVLVTSTRAGCAR